MWVGMTRTSTPPTSCNARPTTWVSARLAKADPANTTVSASVRAVRSSAAAARVGYFPIFRSIDSTEVRVWMAAPVVSST